MNQQKLKIEQPYTKFYEITDILILCGAEFGLLRLGFTWVRQSGYRYSLGAAACFVFAAYFLLRALELRMDGSIYYALITKRGNQVLIKNTHRYFYFRLEDVKRITYDDQKRVLTVSLSRCFTRRCGLFSRDHLWMYQPEETAYVPDDDKIYHYMGNLKENWAQHLSITDSGEEWLGLFPKWKEIAHLTLCGLPILYSFSIICLTEEESKSFSQCIHPEGLQPREAVEEETDADTDPVREAEGTPED